MNGAKMVLHPNAVWKYQNVLVGSICNYEWWKGSEVPWNGVRAVHLVLRCAARS
jgi:hypothetical protein